MVSKSPLECPAPRHAGLARTYPRQRLHSPWTSPTPGGLGNPARSPSPAPQLDLKIGAETPAQRQGPSRGGDPPALHVRPGGGPHGRVGPQAPLRASCHCRPAPWGAGRDVVASHILLQSPSEAAINSPPLVSHGDVRGTGPEGTPPGPPPCASVPGSLSGAVTRPPSCGWDVSVGTRSEPQSECQGHLKLILL